MLKCDQCGSKTSFIIYVSSDGSTWCEDCFEEMEDDINADN